MQGVYREHGRPGRLGDHGRARHGAHMGAEPAARSGAAVALVRHGELSCWSARARGNSPPGDAVQPRGQTAPFSAARGRSAVRSSHLAHACEGRRAEASSFSPQQIRTLPEFWARRDSVRTFWLAAIAIFIPAAATAQSCSASNGVTPPQTCNVTCSAPAFPVCNNGSGSVPPLCTCMGSVTTTTRSTTTSAFTASELPNVISGPSR